MFKVVKEVRWEAAHRLLNYAGKCAHLHGHSYRAIFTFRSQELNSNDMVIDFSILKEKIQEWIDDHWDHSCILNEKDPIVNILGSRVWVMQGNPTAENMAMFLFMLFKFGFSESVLESVEVFEGSKSSAIYTLEN